MSDEKTRNSEISRNKTVLLKICIAEYYAGESHMYYYDLWVVLLLISGT